MTTAVDIHRVTSVKEKVTHYNRGDPSYHFSTKLIQVFTEDPEIPALEITLFSNDPNIFTDTPPVSKDQPVDSEPKVG